MQMNISSPSSQKTHHSFKFSVNSPCMSCEKYRRTQRLTFTICRQCSNQLSKPFYICDQCFNPYHQSQFNIRSSRQKQQKKDTTLKLNKEHYINQYNDQVLQKIEENSNDKNDQYNRVDQLRQKIRKIKNIIFKDVQKLIIDKRFQEADIALKFFQTQIKVRLEKR